MKFPCVGETRAAPFAAALQPARSTSAPAEAGCPSGPDRPRDPGSEDAAGTRRFERLRRLPVRSDSRATARSAAGSPASDPEISRQDQFARALQPALVVTELHVGRGNANLVPDLAAVWITSTLSTSSEIRRPLKWALPKIAPPTVPGVPAQASSPATPRLIVQRTRTVDRESAVGADRASPTAARRRRARG
jgi:hypothetical protein